MRNAKEFRAKHVEHWGDWKSLLEGFIDEKIDRVFALDGYAAVCPPKGMPLVALQELADDYRAQGWTVELPDEECPLFVVY
jgi:hypothetical protein